MVSIVGANGCNKAGEIEIINNGTPPDVTLSTSASICNGGGSINIMYGQGDANITWSGMSNGTANGTNGSFTITDLIAGSYTVTVDTGNGCPVEMTAEILSLIHISEPTRPY